jgi:hypothetical protein
MFEDRPLIVVDAANVIGSRPDGWWRDRPGAARRLIERLQSGPAANGDLVIVLEGEARRGVDEGLTNGIEVVHAAGSGDDRIVDIVRDAVDRRSVVVVTRDRELRERVHALGAETVGPGSLPAA